MKLNRIYREGSYVGFNLVAENDEETLALVTAGEPISGLYVSFVARRVGVLEITTPTLTEMAEARRLDKVTEEQVAQLYREDGDEAMTEDVLLSLLQSGFGPQPFKILVKMFGTGSYTNIGTDEDGHQEFVDLCHAEWDKLDWKEKYQLAKEWGF